MEEDRGQYPIAVIAGSNGQADEYIAGRPGFVHVGRVQDAHCRRFRTFVTVGTWYEVSMSYKIIDAVKANMR